MTTSSRPAASDPRPAVSPAVPAGWRTFGHDGARTFLLRGLRTGRLAHAYLIAGPPRIGKRSLALDLARALNCEAGDLASRPCGDCRQCQRITRGVHADVRVIDPDTPIESARPRPGEEDRVHRVIRKGHVDDLQHRASLKPFEGRHQVFIIDGAETMLAPAANALLKTLEEPEAQVTLVLLTAMAGALPETIVSRCQRIDLRPVPAEAIERHLVEAAGAEPQLARTVALAAGGRPGWALAALADPTAMESRRQALVRVLSVVVGSIEERFRYARTMAATFRKDRAAAADEIAVWLGMWRDVLLTQHGHMATVSNPDYATEMEAIGRAVSAAAAAGAIRSVQGTADALARNAQPALAFDVMMLELPRVDPALLPTLAETDAGGLAPDADEPLA